MTAHRKVKTLQEQRAAAMEIMGKPTYSWYEGVTNDGPIPPPDGMEIILPVGISKVTKSREGREVIYLSIFEFYRGRWSAADWSMRSWSFQTIADYNEMNNLNEENQ